MDTPPSQKKGLGALGWLGIGCGGIVALAIVASIVVYFFFGDKIKGAAENFAKNPTRATADTMVGLGVADMVAADEVNKRYTVKEKKTGKLTTFYWSKKNNTLGQVTGDFSAIPADDLGVPPANGLAPAPAPAAPEPAPAPPAQN